MKYTLLFALLLGLYTCSSFASPAETRRAVKNLYKEHCSVCHGTNRLGVTGPALLPQNLHRLRKKKAFKTIMEGRVATQMLPFKDKLNKQQIEALVDYIFTPLAEPPVWGEKEIRASHIQYPIKSKSDKPVFNADPLNLFLVVESGDHHVTVLDGDKFEPIHRFPSRFALHGGPKYSSTGRYVYFTSRDGWISKFDMYQLKMEAEIRVGINARNTAISSDDRFVMVGNYMPNTLVLLNAKDLSLIKVIPVNDKNGKSSRVSAVYDARPRKSFVAALKDSPEVWEISYQDPPPAGFGKWVHDYRKSSGEATTEKFPIRRIKLDSVLDDFFFDQEYVHILSASRKGKGQVVDLDLGRKVADLDIPGMPHLSSGITWKRGKDTVLATPNLKENVVSIIDMKTWKLIKKIPTLGSGFFIRSHENSPYAWVDVFFGKNKDVMHVIDKQTLEIVKTLRPVKGKTSAHVEFTRDGRYALVSIWEMDGALIVYDAKTLKEVKRIPMKKPVGKYNVYNKITRSAGTSH
jgi:mono/diheme cytochrome c family protein/DNA-binding beta-propeller fold protein YncE